jgi:hypothetical protein
MMERNARIRALLVLACAAAVVLGLAAVGLAGPVAHRNAIVGDQLEQKPLRPQTALAAGDAAAGLRAFGFTLEPLENLTQFNPDVWLPTQFEFLLTNTGDETDTFELKVSSHTNPSWGYEVCVASACQGESTTVVLAPAATETVGVEIFAVGQAGVGSTEFTVTSQGSASLNETYTVTMYAGFTVGAELAADATADGVVLHQNTPNPARGSTRISFSLPREERVILRVYDVAGRAVRSLSRGTYPAGTNSVLWDGRDDAGRRLASGVYLYQLVTSREVVARQMVLVQ